MTDIPSDSEVIAELYSNEDMDAPRAKRAVDTPLPNVFVPDVLPHPRFVRIMVLANQKGGVGKTTTAVNIAAALAQGGLRVLVIDLDPQGNASTALGVQHQRGIPGTYEVLLGLVPFAQAVQTAAEHPEITVLAATPDLAGAEIELVELPGRERRLKTALDSYLTTTYYDYVFIDCPPSLGLLTVNAFVAAYEILLPIQCEYYALEGVSQLLHSVQLIQAGINPHLKISTVLLTMYDSRTRLSQQVADEVRTHFPTQTLKTVIPRSVRVSEAPSYGCSVLTYDVRSVGAKTYRSAAAEIALQDV